MNPQLVNAAYGRPGVKFFIASFQRRRLRGRDRVVDGLTLDKWIATVSTVGVENGDTGCAHGHRIPKGLHITDDNNQDGDAGGKGDGDYDVGPGHGTDANAEGGPGPTALFVGEP